MAASYAIRSIKLENIRGFTTSTFRLSDRNVVLIGENNAGKTSLLRIIDWIINSLDQLLLDGKRQLTPEECDLLLPARPTANRARRLSIGVFVSDGRSGARFGADRENLVTLRIQIKGSGAIARLGMPSRNEKETDPHAAELLKRLRDHYAVIYVPTVRAASSDRFIAELKGKVRPLLEEAFLHNPTGGQTKDYRDSKRALDTITKIATKKADKVWRELPALISGGMLPEANFNAPTSSNDLVDWLVEALQARFTTGAHDATSVGPEELGAGLQSAIWLALMRLSVPTDRQALLLLEEPEAFLHPSAQRILARELLTSSKPQVIASTHSALVVEESDARDLVLVKNHDLFPLRVPNELQNSKDSALLTGYGAEAVFYQSLLLVEGDGDRLYFERLRQKLYTLLPAPVVSKLAVVASGSNTAFGQWVGILERFSDRSNGLPINFIVVGDSIDAVAACSRGLRDGGVSIRKDVESALKGIEQSNGAFDAARAARVVSQTRAANDLARAAGVPLHLMPVDLEHSMLIDASPKLLAAVHGLVNNKFNSKPDLLKHLGSKSQPKAASPEKAPWIRGQIAVHSDWNDISKDVKDLLWRWIEPVMSGQQLPHGRPPELR
ncbi:MAG: ATP-dependent nuclease [Salinibacterium amurskyense]